MIGWAMSLVINETFPVANGILRMMEILANVSLINIAANVELEITCSGIKICREWKDIDGETFLQLTTKLSAIFSFSYTKSIIKDSYMLKTM